MTTFDFDKITDRTNTNSLKYDFAVERGQHPDVMPFWVADMDFPTPPAVIDELVRRSRHGIFGYTDAKADYMQALQAWMRAHHQWAPGSASLLFTPGVVFAISACIRAFTRPGEAVLIQQPVYYPFSAAIEANGRTLVNSSLILKNGRYEIDFADFEQQIIQHKVKLFLLCSPQNPTGRVWRREELEAIHEICQRHAVLVVADEIHHEFTRPDHPHTVFASLSPAAAARTITCTAPSKTFNLAGLQLSNIFVENPDLRRQLRREINAVGYSQPNALGLFASQAAYTYGADWLKALNAYLDENIRRTREFLQKEIPQVRLIEPEGTYLLWLDFSRCGLSDDELDRRIREKARLWLDRGSIFGPEGQGFQRINAACPWSTLQAGLQRLQSAFSKKSAL